MAIDQREYDSTARAGKVSYSPLGPGASRAELEAELSRLRGRLEGVRADMAMAREAYLQLAGEHALLQTELPYGASWLRFAC